MGTLYMAVPRATSAPFDVIEVATGTGLKTLLQVATPSTTDIRIHAWGVSFDGISATAAPGRCTLIDTANASTTGTSLTAEEWEGTDSQASLCVGGTALTAHTLTVEPTETAVRFLDAENVHPQTGYSVFFPESRHPAVKASRFLKVRVLFAADVNCIPWILWEEPA
jgi:hypothetical protein